MTSSIKVQKKYEDVIDLNSLINQLISLRVIDENEYRELWEKVPEERIGYLFQKVSSKGEFEFSLLTGCLHKLYPKVEINDENVDDEHEFGLALVRGSFPVLPDLYIKRSSYCELLQIKLTNLRYNHTLIVSGMMGYGKSSLLNDVLTNKDLLKSYFNNNVFWINTKEHYLKEDVLQDMWKLYLSAIQVSGESPISHCPEDLEKLKTILTQVFQQSRLKNALLVLDNVSNKEVLSAFDIKCKTVITTQQKNLVNKFGTQSVEVKTGFTRNESMALIKKALNIGVNGSLEYTSEALKIHEICKGHPTIMAHIASFLRASKDDARNSKKIWMFIERKLLQGNLRFNSYDAEGQQIEKNISMAIEMCIEKLPTELKHYYYDLVIFMLDVNISTRVLEVLWDVDEFTVRSIMNEFIKKSLIVSFYNKRLNTYVYGIHDLHHNYLKRRTSPEKIKQLHKNLIESYDRITNKDYSKLPRDNYSLHYIAYHLYQAKEFDRFSIFFDLKFIEAKVKVAGPADVIYDMTEYEESITNGNPELKEKLENYKSFISDYGHDIFIYDNIAIIQYGLQTTNDSHVYREARILATMNDEISNVYFDLPVQKDRYNYIEPINLEDTITCACYSSTNSEIFIGTAKGSIKLFSHSNKKIFEIGTYSEPVVKLMLCPEKTYLLAIYEDGVIRIWECFQPNARRSWDFTNNHAESPKAKQSFWKNLHSSDENNIDSIKYKEYSAIDDSFISASFSNNFKYSFLFTTGSARGQITVWNHHLRKSLCYVGASGFPAYCVTFSNNDSRILFNKDTNILIYDIDTNTVQYLMQLHGSELYNKALFVKDETIFAVSETSIVYWKNYINGPSPQLLVNTKSRNTCAAITEDSLYIIISTSDNNILMWDINKEEVINDLKIHKGSAKSLDTLYDEDHSVHVLLISSDKTTLQQCHIQTSNTNLPAVTCYSVFSSHWLGCHPLIAILNSNQQILVYKGYALISESHIKDAAVTCICFSVCGNNVLYGLEDGKVGQYSYKSKKETELMFLNSSITFLKCFDLVDNPSSCFSYSSSMDSIDFNNGVIVAAAENGYVYVKIGDNLYKRQFEKPTSFYLTNTVLVVVNEKGRFFVWDIHNDTCNESKSINLDVYTTSSEFYVRKSLLTITYHVEENHYLTVYDLSDYKFGKIFEVNLKNKATTTQFSPNGKLLAVGFESGALQVFNLTDNSSIELSVHETPVNYLLFSSDEDPLLISLAEQIAFWDLRKLIKTNKKRCLSNLQLSPLTEEFKTMNLGYWTDKSAKNGHLLACIKLHDHYAKFVSASRDFTSFFIIDDKGKIYITEVISAPTAVTA